ncbi:MAG: NAD+ synthase [Bacteroidales bacterium]|nr:NAD+ synthase [Bacteroidales bacterium]
MRIALAQLNYTIGAFDENSGKIIATIARAKKEKADLIVFSELSVCGYPPMDLLEYRYFIDHCEQTVLRIANECEEITAIVGSPVLNTNSIGKNIYNAAYIIQDKTIQGVVYKTLLPTYDIFDEYRYFERNRKFRLCDLKGHKVAITICEDLWYHQPVLDNFGKERLYTVDPMKELSRLKPEFVINIAASPFSYTQSKVREEIITRNARIHKVPIIYVNQTGANTELIFDGGSLVINAKGAVIDRMELFKEDFKIIDTDELLSSTTARSLPGPEDITASVHDALVTGIRDYFRKLHFSRAVLGLSGGIDSAVTLVLACRALGAENLRVLLMPSQYSSDHSVNDAVDLAQKLGVKYDILPIREIFGQYQQSLQPLFCDLPPDLAEENIQARIRGNLLMALSNKFGHILLNTSNKSEAAVGYGTLYGDMSGGLSVLGDVYKTDVYKLAAYINNDGIIIPQHTITKPPSAELRPGQKDSDSLPDYEILDKVLFHYIELAKSSAEIAAMGIEESLVKKIIGMVTASEYKRYQTPPILRISCKAFGMGRRMPLVAKY